ncbi:hypothetical protein M413DRAFT_14342 [Hebeloma cylindrosporum]|uniref:Uncharacterized protein n=1 Tax=Hebeloma cylindrosporum TaxID=76867 RepID=A0A0C3BWI7_HEBCY|nr:hypothetical protein M413DRAFT_14342 [Hebeloma cylindrosporum h7]
MVVKLTLDNTIGAAFLGISASCILYALRIWKRKPLEQGLPNNFLPARENKVGRRFSRVWPIFVALVVTGGWGADCQDHLSPDFHSAFLSPFLGLGFTVIAKTYETTSFTNLEAMSNQQLTGSLSACSLSSLVTTFYWEIVRTSTGNLVIQHPPIDHKFEVYINSYIAMLNARKFMNEREKSSSVDVNSSIMRSGLTVRPDTLIIPSVDDKITPDDVALSETKFTSSFPTPYDPERGIPSRHVGVKPFNDSRKLEAEFIL